MQHAAIVSSITHQMWEKSTILVIGFVDGFFSLINSVYGFVSDTEEIICDNKFLIGNTDESWLEHKRMPIIVQ